MTNETGNVVSSVCLYVHTSNILSSFFFFIYRSKQWFQQAILFKIKDIVAYLGGEKERERDRSDVYLNLASL